jgi:hypothetical protein
VSSYALIKNKASAEEKVMVESFILVEGNVNEEKFRISLGNAKQLVVGSVAGSGTILHVAATSATDLTNALVKFAQVEGVKGVTTLTLRNG